MSQDTLHLHRPIKHREYSSNHPASYLTSQDAQVTPARGREPSIPVYSIWAFDLTFQQSVAQVPHWHCRRGRFESVSSTQT